MNQESYRRLTPNEMMISLVPCLCQNTHYCGEKIEQNAPMTNQQKVFLTTGQPTIIVDTTGIQVPLVLYHFHHP